MTYVNTERFPLPGSGPVRYPNISYLYVEQLVRINNRRDVLSVIFYLSMSLGDGALFPSEISAIFYNKVSVGKEGNFEREFLKNSANPLVVFGH